MRYDRGTRIYTLTTCRRGERVWVPYVDGWYRGFVAFVQDAAVPYAAVHFNVLGVADSHSHFPLWQLRQRNPRLNGADRPDEPVPPTHGRPRGNPAKSKNIGILSNGDVRGRC